MQPVHRRIPQHRHALHTQCYTPTEVKDTRVAHALYKKHRNPEQAWPPGTPGPCPLLKSTGPWLWAASPLEARVPAHCSCKGQISSDPQASSLLILGSAQAQDADSVSPPQAGVARLTAPSGGWGGIPGVGHYGCRTLTLGKEASRMCVGILPKALIAAEEAD